MFRTVWAIGFALTLAGCVGGNLPATQSLPLAQQTLFLIGVDPAEARITLFPGTVGNGRFDTIFGSVAAFSSHPVDGYVLGKVDGGQKLGIAVIQIGGMFSTDLYRPCNDQKTLVFDTPAGRVIYLTDIFFMQDGNVLRPRFIANLPAARAFLRKHYPALADRLESGHYELLPTTFECVAR